VDSDFPVVMAGERLGFGPMQIRAGLSDGSLSGLRLSSAIGSLWPSRLMGNPMAPEHSEPGYSARGGVQPEVSYGA
jgi:hypothetical protein